MTAHRVVSAEGEFADEEAIQAAGWRLTTTSLPRVVLDSRRGEHWRISRLWSTGAVLEASVLPAGTWRAFIGVEGEAVVTTPTAAVALRGRDVLLVPGEVPVSTRNEGPWARFVWEVDHPALGQPRFRSTLGARLSFDEVSWNLIATITNVLAPSGESSDRYGDPFLADVVGFTLLAAVAEAGAVDGAEGGAPPSLYRTALRLIDEHHRDPSLTVTSLAQRLAISVPHLHRLFAREGTRPRIEIERRRVATALRLKDFVGAESSAEEVAVASGFTTVERMTSALQRHDDARSG
ncbi:MULTISPECIES: hypothetical protein [Bacteria]|uniref:hypothetical protein n=1 Tax=Bacteria TaxID=2 RepID=UPI003C7B7CB3